jgi:Carboxylesterase family
LPQATGNFYNFSNVRYAAPPLGDLRFAAPQAPAENRSAVQTGSDGRVCPQANPAWEAIAAQFIPEYLLGQPINITTTGSSSQTTVQLDPRTNEDCLFLDVVVPKSILDQAGKDGCKGAPVLGESSDFSGSSKCLRLTCNSLDIRRRVHRGRQIRHERRIPGRPNTPQQRQYNLRIFKLSSGRFWMALRPYIPSKRNSERGLARPMVRIAMGSETHFEIRR